MAVFRHGTVTGVQPPPSCSWTRVRALFGIVFTIQYFRGIIFSDCPVVNNKDLVLLVLEYNLAGGGSFVFRVTFRHGGLYVLRAKV